MSDASNKADGSTIQEPSGLPVSDAGWQRVTASAQPSVEAEVKQTHAEYDYVIVGSGAGGGTVAGNLAKAGYKVLVLEAGSDCSDDYHTQVPVFHALSTEDDKLSWDFFVKHYTDEKRQKGDSKYNEQGKGILYPRAGTLGGCTAHNAMIMVYPHNSDWDKIAEITGDSSWHSNNMRTYFERLERCRYGIGNTISRFIGSGLKMVGISFNPRRRGYKGWLQTSIVNPLLLIEDKSLLRVVYEAVEQTVEEHVGKTLRRLRRGLDPNDWGAVGDRSEGLALTPMTTKKGQRTSTRDYLKNIRQKYPQNLTIQTNSLATKVLLDNDRKAIGIEYLEGEHLYRADPNSKSRTDNGRLRQIYVKKEVILACGAFNTPQLLKLSGIGPKEELNQHGIEIRVDLPGVGENLQDRYEVGIVSKMQKDFLLLKNASFKADISDPNFREWKKGKGLYTSNGAIIGIIKRSEKSRPDPDLYIFGLAGFFQGYLPGYSTAHIKDKDYFTWAILKGHTRNRAGRVALKSSNPRDMPEINFRYFDDDPNAKKTEWEEDLNSVVEGVEFVRRMNGDPGLQGIIEEEVVPGPNVRTKSEIREFVKKEAWGHHASCSCKIGARSDRMAVLDNNFRVYGTKNLRVVDASVFPHIPGLFIVSAVYMIGEKASDVIIADAKSQPT